MNLNDARLAVVWKLLTHANKLFKLAERRGHNPAAVVNHVRVWLAAGDPNRPGMEGVSYAEMRVEIRRLLDEWGIQ